MRPAQARWGLEDQPADPPVEELPPGARGCSVGSEEQTSEPERPDYLRRPDIPCGTVRWDAQTFFSLWI